MKRLAFRAMGSRMLAALDNPSPEAQRALQRVPAWFEEWEQAFSRFRDGSELNRLNRSNGRAFAVSQALWEVFHAAREAEAYTGGLVRPTMLAALVEAGYDRSFELLRTEGRVPPAALLDGPRSTSEIRWDEGSRTLRVPESVQLDFGGVAKGWAAQKAVERLAQYGPALVDAGGDVAVSGPNAEGRPWAIGIRDPFQPDTHFETLGVKCGGVATSGTDYHRWLQGGVWNHHLIDPATGLPAETDVLTATVIAPDAMRAEAAAKAATIAGSLSGLEWLEADETLAGVLVLQSGETIYSRRMPAYLWRSS